MDLCLGRIGLLKEICSQLVPRKCFQSQNRNRKQRQIGQISVECQKSQKRRFVTHPYKNPWGISFTQLVSKWTKWLFILYPHKNSPISNIMLRKLFSSVASHLDYSALVIDLTKERKKSKIIFKSWIFPVLMKYRINKTYKIFWH